MRIFPMKGAADEIINVFRNQSMSETNIEKIGNVTLDLRFYGGADLYCDGAVEDELLEIVKEHDPQEYPAIIAERKSWPILYHLSDLRENIVSWLRIPEAKTSEPLMFAPKPL